jgi:signal transduction histidine kinase
VDQNAIDEVTRLPAQTEPGRTRLEAGQQENEYVAIAAHDMKNQIGVIRAMAQLLERQVVREPGAEPAALLHGLAIIQRGTRKLQGLVEEFLDLSRLQIGDLIELNDQPTDLVALARASVQEFQESSRRDITFSTAQETLVGQWDAARLDRVIGNLLSNAIKFSTPPGAIRVTLDSHRPDDGSTEDVTLVVHDEGVGIPATDLAAVSTLYYRASNVVRTTIGTGIGLFGSRSIIEQQGGSLQLESTEGVGTTVTVRLPRDPLPLPNMDAASRDAALQPSAEKRSARGQSGG